uniref:protein FAM200C-like n=1 Tax=Myxine glutinosa TaxID=7769 RepID=UPI00358EA1AE
MAMSAKKRKYQDEYIKFGFVALQKGDAEVPQCVICYKTLSNDAMRPTRLERHLRTTHPELADKSQAFFVAKREALKRAKLDSSGTFRQQTSKIVEASYEIALLVAKNKKSHTIRETLIKPSLLRAAELILGKDSANKLSAISLSNNTIKGRIDEMSQDIKEQVTDQIRASPVFAIQCDETTDVAQCSQLLMYARFILGDSVKEEMLFCHPLETYTTAADAFEVVSKFFEENRLSWDALVGVCTDGAPAMLGSHSGFVTKVKPKSPSAIGTHCVIHRESLASNTLPAEMRDFLNLAIKVVNFIESGALNSRLFKQLCKDLDCDHQALLFHTNVRWLSKGNMLGRVYELREEVATFLDVQRKADLYKMFQSRECQLSLAYLVDIFEALNGINQKLQGKHINIITQYDAIRAFMAKLDLWKCRMEAGNIACFPNLDSAVPDGLLNSKLKNQIIDHLTELKADFIRYFPDFDEKRKTWKFIRNPFQCDVADVSDGVQEEFLELKFNSSAEDDFEILDLETFWVKYLPVYPLISLQAVRILTMFGSTYLCEAAFSALVAVKTKYRSKLNVEGDLRCALSGTRPQIPDLIAKKQCQPSH